MTNPGSAWSRLRANHWVRVAAGVVLVGAAIWGINHSALRPVAPSAAAGTLPEVTFLPTRAPVAGEIPPGVWLVGSDVQPGTYRSTGAGDGGYCMWSRHNTLAGGPLDGIVTSDGALSPGSVLVTIAATDKVFRTRGCAPFTRVG